MSALAALGASAPSDAAALAEPLLHATDPWLRLGAVEALRAAPATERARLLSSEATDPSRAVRWAVAPLLGSAGAGAPPAGARNDIAAHDVTAETLLRKARDLYPDSADAHFALGMLLVRRQEIAAGVSELGRANALAPNNSQYAYAYAVGLHSTRQDEHAMAALSEARARFPDNAPIQSALRALCADRGGPSRDRRCP